MGTFRLSSEEPRKAAPPRPVGRDEPRYDGRHAPCAPYPDRLPDEARPARLRFGLADLAASLGAVAASTGIGFLLSGRQSLPDVVMVYVLGVVVVATRFSFAAAILAALLSVLAYDFLFIPPYSASRSTTPATS